MDLFVIIPAFNEENTLSDVIKGMPNLKEIGINITIIIVDDGSTDRTAQIARDAGAVVISHGTNQGVGRSFADGLTYALENGADIMVNIDADLQYNPADIARLIQPILDNKADFVTADRFTTPTGKAHRPENMSAIKFWGNQRMNKLVNSLAGTSLGDVSSGFRAISREAILNLNLSGSYTYTHETIIDLAFKQLRLISVPLPVKYYPDRRSKVAGNLFSYTSRAMSIIFKSFKNYKPLHFFTILASIPGLLGLAALIFMMVHYLLVQAFSPYKFIGLTGIYLDSLAIILLIVGFLADILVGIRMTEEKQLYLQKKAMQMKSDPGGK